jgi:hypothetical protein
LSTSAELAKAAADLCAWGQKEGVAMFVVHTTDNGNVRYIGPKLPPALVARMLRAAADGYEAQKAPERLN